MRAVKERRDTGGGFKREERSSLNSQRKREMRMNRWMGRVRRDPDQMHSRVSCVRFKRPVMFHFKSEVSVFAFDRLLMMSLCNMYDIIRSKRMFRMFTAWCMWPEFWNGIRKKEHNFHFSINYSFNKQRYLSFSLETSYFIFYSSVWHDKRDRPIKQQQKYTIIIERR